MVKNVTVTVVGVQRSSQEEKAGEPIELVTRGRLHEKEGKYFLKYDEYFEDLQKPVQNLVKFDENSLELAKKGEVSASMTFGHDMISKGFYMTPDGTLDVSVRTEDYILTILDSAIDIVATYIMDYGGDFVTFNLLKMKLEW